MELAKVPVDVAEGEDEELNATDVGVPGEAAGGRFEVKGVDLGVDFGVDEVDEFGELLSRVGFVHGDVVAVEIGVLLDVVGPLVPAGEVFVEVEVGVGEGVVGDSPVVSWVFAGGPDVVRADLDRLAEHRQCGVVLALEGFADFLHFWRELRVGGGLEFPLGWSTITTAPPVQPGFVGTSLPHP